jgi:hypothetical protein
VTSLQDLLKNLGRLNLSFPCIGIDNLVLHGFMMTLFVDC